jgi:hypothetical protein
VLNRKEKSAATNNPEDQRYFLSGRQMGEITSDGILDPGLSDYATNINLIRNMTPRPQSAPFRWEMNSGATRGTFGPGAGYEYINPFGNGAQSASGGYTVRDGDTLQGIAASAWGDASLWYLIAEANGLNAGTQLVAGQGLILPDRVTNAQNNSGTFKVYDPNAALGELSPTSAKPPKKPGACAVVGQIIMIAIAVGVTILTSGALASLGTVVAGAIGGAAGSIASQAFGVATGIQSKFDWKGVAMGAIGGAVGGAMGGGGIFGKAGAFGGVQSSFVQGALRGVVSSALTQGIGVATGLQDKFSWAGIAGAGVGGGLSNMVSTRLEKFKLGNTFLDGLSSGVSAGGNAAARSLITGTSFGDNLLAALPDVIGGTIGNMFARGVQGSGSRGIAEESSAESGGMGGPYEPVEPGTIDPGDIERPVRLPDGRWRIPPAGDIPGGISDFKSTMIGEIVLVGMDNDLIDDLPLRVRQHLSAEGNLITPERVLELGDRMVREAASDWQLGKAVGILYRLRADPTMATLGMVLTEEAMYRWESYGRESEAFADAQILHILRAGLPPLDTVMTAGEIARDGVSPGEALKQTVLTVLHLRQAERIIRVEDAVERTANIVAGPSANGSTLSMEEATDGLRTANGRVAEAYANRIAELSTSGRGTIDRVVLGKFETPTTGYMGEARRNGGIYFNLRSGPHDRLVTGLSAATRRDKEWIINRAFLRQQLESGVGRFDFVGNWSDHINQNRGSALAREFIYLRQNAPTYGYSWNGSSWIKG